MHDVDTAKARLQPRDEGQFAVPLQIHAGANDLRPTRSPSAGRVYYDRPHLKREFRALARRTPASFAASGLDLQDGVGAAA